MAEQQTVRRALLMSGIGAVAAAGLVGPGTANADTAPACPDVQVVFARGTAEPAGLGRVGQAFVDDLGSALGARSIAAYAVNYPASYDFLQSAPQGADDASAHIQATAASCPGTSIVVGGYSQGAAVVDLITADPGTTFGFGRPMPPAVADHVAAVAVFGNPAGRIGRTLSSASPLYGAKAIELCNGADPVCSNGEDRPAHSRYVEVGMPTQAAAFVSDKLAGQGSRRSATMAGKVAVTGVGPG